MSIALPSFSLVNLLILIGALGLAVQAFVGLAFFISSIWKKEKRATYYAGLQFLGILILLLFLFLASIGFFHTGFGIANHFRHYDLVLSPLAADAGLGEVGRIGYLMTKEFSERLRNLIQEKFSPIELLNNDHSVFSWFERREPSVARKCRSRDNRCISYQQLFEKNGSRNNF